MEFADMYRALLLQDYVFVVVLVLVFVLVAAGLESRKWLTPEDRGLVAEAFGLHKASVHGWRLSKQRDGRRLFLVYARGWGLRFVRFGPPLGHDPDPTRRVAS